jgi:hypothetical protein
MKKILFIVLLFPLLWSGCKGKVEGFDMIYKRDYPKVIPVGVSIFLSHYFVLEDIKPDFVKNAKTHNVTEVDIKRILPKFFRISSRFGDTDFSFVREVTVNIYPHGDKTLKTEVFYRTDIPLNTGTSINLNAGTADLKNILIDDTNSYDLEVKMVFRATPPANIETVADFSFFAVTNE